MPFMGYINLGEPLVTQEISSFQYGTHCFLFYRYTTGKKFMQIGGNTIRTYTSDIPSLGSIWSLIQLQLFIWKVEYLAAKTPITDPYSSPHAAELDGETIDSFMRKNFSNKAVMELVDAAIKTTFGTDAKRIGALFFLAYANSSGGVMKLFEARKEAAQEAIVKGGMQQVSELLAQKLGSDVVLLQHPVKRLKQNEYNVVVTTMNGKEFVCSRLIIAAPPNMLLKMEFDPPLPPYKQFLCENLPIGHTTKFLVTYRKAFWREKGYSGEVVSNGGKTKIPGVSCGPLSICFDAVNSNGVPALVGFISGRQGTEWHNKTKIEREAAVIISLVKIFGGDAKEYVTYVEKIWADEPYNGGCPTTFGVPGCMYAFPHLRLPFDKIHFAGTDTATYWVGYVSGAVQSGERAKTEVLHHIRPDLIKKSDLKDTCYDPKWYKN
ncbi:hypothetical protein SK128_021483 [Halocaridina rubra]|uniref:Amine oxidase n=1 Tax=Halocaridina rubra TaxID=373956 RepID=A0AAN8ZT88_HALRR